MIQSYFLLEAQRPIITRTKNSRTP